EQRADSLPGGQPFAQQHRREEDQSGRFEGDEQGGIAGGGEPDTPVAQRGGDGEADETHPQDGPPIGCRHGSRRTPSRDRERDEDRRSDDERGEGEGRRAYVLQREAGHGGGRVVEQGVVEMYDVRE